MRRLLVILLLSISGSVVAAAGPVLTGVSTAYPLLPSPVKIWGTNYAAGTVAYGPVGSPVVISGSDFGTAGTVTFAGNGMVVAAITTSWSPTSIVAAVPSGAITGQVVVTVNGQTSSGRPFIVTPGTYNAACGTMSSRSVPQGPTISALTPAFGVVGTVVIVSGSNFGGSGAVTFACSGCSLNQITATPVSWDTTTIVVPVPLGATTGALSVTVGGYASSKTFTVQEPGNCLANSDCTCPVSPAEPPLPVKPPIIVEPGQY